MGEIDKDTEFIKNELNRIIDKWGNPRLETDRFASYRMMVTNNINYAYKKLNNSLPELVKHFRENLRTGKDICYNSKLDWHL